MFLHFACLNQFSIVSINVYTVFVILALPSFFLGALGKELVDIRFMGDSK